MSNRRLFFVSFFTTVVVVVAYFYFTQSKPRSRSGPPDLVRINRRVYLTSQLQPQHILPLGERGFRTIIDIRPDGEEPGQPSSVDIRQRAQGGGLKFHYVPVPHDNIPDEAVAAVKEALSEDPAPVLLYCRTGRRAARTLALAEASRADGPSCDSILNMVKAAGFSAEDLKDNITQRIAQRPPTPAPAAAKANP